METYFARPVLRMMIQQPLVAANRQGQYDVVCTVSGGGLSGQAGAVRHGLSKALMRHEPDLRPALKRGGFLTRDSRVRRAQEIRPRQSAAELPVLEAVDRHSGTRALARGPGIHNHETTRSGMPAPISWWRWLWISGLAASRQSGMILRERRSRISLRFIRAT